jgi:hypothetical protein
MPASVDPKLVLIGVSPGNSPRPKGKVFPGGATSFTSAPTVDKPLNSHIFYEDSSGYWNKLRYLTRSFALAEGTGLSLSDAVALCTHFNLGTQNAGKATEEATESDIVRWVSQLLNRVHSPDWVVLFGLLDILVKKTKVASVWNHKQGLIVDWKRFQETRLAGHRYRFREWKTRNSLGHEVHIVLWPNHPSQHPCADFEEWKKSVDQFVRLRLGHLEAPESAPGQVPKAPHADLPEAGDHVSASVSVSEAFNSDTPNGWGLTFGSASGSAAARINCQLCDLPKTIAQICEGTARDCYGPEPVTWERARDHLTWHFAGNSGRQPERRSSRTFVRGLIQPSPGRFYLPTSINPRRTA